MRDAKDLPDPPSRLDTTLKIVAVLVTVAGVIPGLITALGTARINAQAAVINAKNAEHAAMNARIAMDNAKREAQKPYLNRMMPLYADMIQETGRISSAAYNTGGINDAVTKRYHELYAGEIRLFAADNVNTKIEDFEKLLSSINPKTTNRQELNSNSSRLGRASIDLARAMHAHIASMTGGP